MHYEPIFQDWMAPITRLEGIGPKLAERLSHLLGGTTLLDLVFHLPLRWTDRQLVRSFDEARIDEIQTVRGIVQNFL